jgi:hypothetical protein
MEMAHRLVRTALACALLAPLSARAVVDAQIDTFESGTTAGWEAGAPHPLPPQNVASGGPDGADDNFLQLGSHGSIGPGGRLAAFNPMQWSGDYTAAGIGAILVDVNNLGASDLSLRLFFADAPGMTFTDAAISTDPVVVPAGSGWVTVIFPITAADLTAVAGDVAQALAGTERLWILHNPTAAFPPVGIAAALGVDNIEALPEPSTAAALGAGFALLIGLDRARAQRRRPFPRSHPRP